MPKNKTHKGLAKRVKVTAGKKIIHRKPGAGHLLSNKSGRHLQNVRRRGRISDVYVKRLLEALNAL